MVQTRDYAMSRLRRLEAVLWQVIANAWREYEHDYRSVRGNHRPGTQATVLHDLIVKQIRLTLFGLPGVLIIEQPQTILVSVDNEWLLKFKLLRPGSLRSATNQTSFAGDFFSQQPVQLTLFKEPTHLVVGYVLNKTRSGMESVHVVCPRDTQRNAWDFQIEPVAAQATTVTALPKPPRSRVKPKVQREVASNEGEEGARGSGAG